MLLTDVAVVGGGPAGAAAAVALARAGRDVVVVDKARFPRDKCCGDGLTAGALRTLEGLGLDPQSVASWLQVDDVVLRSPSGREVRLPLPRGQGVFAAVARRMDLDAAVLDLARAAGAKVLDGHACTGATNHADRIVLDVEGIGEVHARYAIGADGM
ncbi:MAG: NAD(P)/FAD-dependent oxidoreductase, partial [Acidimicrobiales bacterium]